MKLLEYATNKTKTLIYDFFLTVTKTLFFLLKLKCFPPLKHSFTRMTPTRYNVTLFINRQKCYSLTKYNQLILEYLLRLISFFLELKLQLRLKSCCFGASDAHIIHNFFKKI